jgi:hypothetical protein
VYLFQTSNEFGLHCKGRPTDLLYGIIFGFIFYVKTMNNEASRRYSTNKVITMDSKLVY